jgi:hypothetical protein
MNTHALSVGRLIGAALMIGGITLISVFSALERHTAVPSIVVVEKSR